MKKNPFLQLILIRFLEFIREPGIIFWSLIFPIAMAWVLGIAFTKRADMVQTVAFVQQESEYKPLQKFLKDAKKITIHDSIKAFQKSIVNEKLGRTTYEFIPLTWSQSLVMLKKGETNMIVMGYQDSIRFYFDPSNPEAKLTYIMLTSAIHNEELVYESASIRPLTQIGTRYIDFLIPGLIALGVMNSILWGISYGLIDLRVKKLLRRMVATPMKKSGFLFSHFIARLSLSFLEALILLSFSFWYFDIKIQGSIPALILLFLVGNFAFSGIAILIASRVSDSRIGTGIINAVILPMTVMSGIFFSYHNFPEKVIPVIKAMPLTMFADGIRSIFIEAAGFQQIFPQLIVLSIVGLVTFILGLKFYKWY